MQLIHADVVEQAACVGKALIVGHVIYIFEIRRIAPHLRVRLCRLDDLRKDLRHGSLPFSNIF